MFCSDAGILHHLLCLTLNIYIFSQRLMVYKLGQYALLRFEHPSVHILLSPKYSISSVHKIMVFKLGQWALLKCKHSSAPFIIFQPKSSITSELRLISSNSGLFYLISCWITSLFIVLWSWYQTIYWGLLSIMVVATYMKKNRLLSMIYKDIKIRLILIIKFTFIS